MRRLVPVLAGLLILTGCEQTAPMRIEPGWASCADAIPDTTKAMSSDSLDLPPLDDGFTPTAAVVCATAFEMDPDFSQRNFLTEGRTDDIAGLLAALRLPSEHRWGACTAIDHIIPFVVLLDADNRWVRPGTPSDSCGTIREEVRDAVTALKLTPVSKRLIREDLSSGAGKATCAEHWADMVWVRTTTRDRRTQLVHTGHATAARRRRGAAVCYTVADSTRGSPHADGRPRPRRRPHRQAVAPHRREAGRRRARTNLRRPGDAVRAAASRRQHGRRHLRRTGRLPPRDVPAGRRPTSDQHGR
ncbi:hypothetical protein ACFQX7_00050 [Luedemannella flava]